MINYFWLVNSNHLSWMKTLLPKASMFLCVFF